MCRNDGRFTINVFLSQIYIFLQHVFVFDEVFDSVCSNQDVYEGTAKPLVQHVLQGCVKIDYNDFLSFLSFYPDLVKYSLPFFLLERSLYVCESLI